LIKGGINFSNPHMQDLLDHVTGKTRISVEFKNQTKNLNHTGVYYNAFSEDLFVWDNDIPNNKVV
jgi:hypothetical protein